VVEDLKPVTIGNTALEGFNRFIFEFHNLPTPETDQVIVMSSASDRFISRLTVSKFSFLRQPQAGEEFQGPVNRGISDFGVGLDNLGVNLGKVPVAVGTEEEVKNLLALLRGFEPPA
jgi:hypothetical protein